MIWLLMVGCMGKAKLIHKKKKSKIIFSKKFETRRFVGVYFRTYLSGWIGMFSWGTLWLLTHGRMVFPLNTKYRFWREHPPPIGGLLLLGHVFWQLHAVRPPSQARPTCKSSALVPLPPPPEREPAGLFFFFFFCSSSCSSAFFFLGRNFFAFCQEMLEL